jgi:hypothetical protein
MKKEDQAKEARKQKRLAILGSNNPVCVICAEDDWRCIEQHHIPGQAYGDDLCNVCRNCHRKLSDNQKDHPAMIDKTPTPQESIGHFLIGLADLFALLVERLREFGRVLIQSASAIAGE